MYPLHAVLQFIQKGDIARTVLVRLSVSEFILNFVMWTFQKKFRKKSFFGQFPRRSKLVRNSTKMLVGYVGPIPCKILRNSWP